MSAGSPQPVVIWHATGGTWRRYGRSTPGGPPPSGGTDPVTPTVEATV